MKYNYLIIILFLTACGPPDYYHDSDSEKTVKISESERKAYIKPVINKEFLKTIDNQDIPNTVAKISYEPNEDKREELYKSALVDLHEALFERVGDEYYKNEAEQKALLDNYRIKQDFITERHYEMFDSLASREVDFSGRSFTSKESYKTTSIFSEVTSQLICFVLDEITPGIPIRSGKKPKGEGLDAAIQGGICTYIFNEMLKPLNQYFEEYAIINAVKTMFVNEHQRNEIMELATAKDVISVTVEDEYEREFLWGWASSKANINMQVTGTFKAGFDLEKYYNVSFNNQNNIINIGLPEPEILSTETDFTVNSIDNGFIQEIGEEEFNKSLAKTKVRLYELANSSDLTERAKAKMQTKMSMLIEPFLITQDEDYKINITFGIKDYTVDEADEFLD